MMEIDERPPNLRVYPRWHVIKVSCNFDERAEMRPSSGRRRRYLTNFVTKTHALMEELKRTISGPRLA